MDLKTISYMIVQIQRIISGMPRLVPGGEVHVLPVRVSAGEQDQHVDHLQEVRAGMGSSVEFV